MGSLTNWLNNHEVSLGFEDSARWCGRDPVDALHPELSWSSGESDNVILCPSECITDNISMCHTGKEQSNPSQSTVLEFVLPMKIHFRYCWLFSGVPCHTAKRLWNRAESLTDRELLWVNRTLMTGEEPELCSQVCCDKIDFQQDIKSFWLTTDGRLVYVDRLSEDIKFRRIRLQNMRVALSLWTTNPELCGQAMRDSGLAHGNLIGICGEAARLSNGNFYNLYTKYPLPINTDGEKTKNLSIELIWVSEKAIDSKEIRSGGELLLQLQPLYSAYFSFITDKAACNELRERVVRLGAEWLVQQDYSEVESSLNLRRNWVTRIVITLALFLAMP